MRRGFKAEAERIASRVRRQMGVSATEALDTRALARHAGAEVRDAQELTSLERLEELEAIQPGAFSACTFTIGDRHVIVYSPLSSPGRTQSDIAHEVAHLLLGHEVNTVKRIGDLSFYTCNPDEEQEATWLAGCLLLPRPLLLRAARQRMDSEAISEAFEVSEQMAAFRLRTTGVAQQASAERAKH